MLLLCLLIFLAGFVDSIAGGGGLISLTSYYAMGLPPVIALGNNKFSSTFGTVFALAEYQKKGTVAWPLALFTSAFALVGAFIGAQAALIYSDLVLKYLMLFAVPVIAFITFHRPSMKRKAELSGARLLCFAAIIGTAVGMYDGFFGPGTGVFLTLAFTSIAGLDTLTSCGNTKVVNLASNIAALTTFVINGNINYTIGLPCVFFAIAGNITGSKVAIKGGGKIVRPMILVVLTMLFIKIVIDTFT